MNLDVVVAIQTWSDRTKVFEWTQGGVAHLNRVLDLADEGWSVAFGLGCWYACREVQP